MNREMIATTSISIHASAAVVWDALVNPEIIKEYMHGTETHSNWTLGSPINFTGEYNGIAYADKGTILEINPLRVLSYSYWSSLSGTDDFEDNYSHITYHLSEFDDNTILVITQDNLETDDQVINAEENWMNVGDRLKNILEQH